MTPMDPAPPSGSPPPAVPLAITDLLVHASRAKILARRLVQDAAAADDLLQRMGLAALERAPRQAERAPAWIARVLRNLAWKQRRDDGRRVVREAAAAAREALPGPSEVVAELEAHRLLAGALQALDEPYRETLTRRWYRDEKPAAIAAAMAVPVRTVETRLARGLERLRGELTTRRGSPEAWCTVLLPLAVTGECTAMVAGSGAVAGGGLVGWLAAGVVAMNSWTKIVALGMALLLATATWQAWPERATRPPLAATGESSAATTAAVVAAPAARTEDGPGDDETPTQEDAGATPRCVLHLLDPDGVVVDSFGGVWIGSDDSTEVLHPLPAGGATLPVPPVDGELLLTTPRLVPTRARIVAGTRELEVRAVRGTEWSGVVRVDGAPPHRPLSGWLHVVTPLARLRDLPDRLRHASMARDAACPSIAFPIAEDGSFRVAGLDPDTRAEFEAPAGHSFAPIETAYDGELRLVARLAVERPGAGVALDLFSPPIVVAQVVDESGEPILRGRATLRANTAGGGLTMTQSFRDGHVEFRLGQARCDDVELRLCDAIGPSPTRFARVTVDEPLTGRRDLGTIVARPAPGWRYRLRDRDGAPIRGARFLALEGHDPRGAPLLTGRSEGTLDGVDPAATELFVAAEGFLPLFVGLAGRSPSSTLDLLLDRANELAISFAAPPAGTQPASIRVELAADRLPFEPSSERALIDGLLPAGFGNLTESAGGADGWRGELELDRGAVARLAGLLSGLTVRLTALDPLGTPWARASVALAATEQRTVVLEPHLALRPFVARVVDADGRPVAGARVTVRAVGADEPGGWGGTSDEHGLITAPHLACERVTVTAQAAGCADAEWRDLPVAASSTPVLLELPRGFDLTVAVVDAVGAPLTADQLESIEATCQPTTTHLPSPTRFDAELTSDGTLLFRGLPRGECRLNVRFAGHVHEELVATPTDLRTITLPPTGDVVVRYDLPLPDEERAGRVLVAVELESMDDSGARVAVDAPRFDPPRRRGAVRFPAVLPGRYQVVLRVADEALLDADWERAFREAREELTNVLLNATASATCEVEVRR